jgi:hypothetical protein
MREFIFSILQAGNCGGGSFALLVLLQVYNCTYLYVVVATLQKAKYQRV